MASKIEDYGIVGDTKTVALVSRTGSIDWFCAPRFDSAACFAALLGYDEHGHWSLRPTVVVRQIDQHYRGDTLILETVFTCDGGVIRIIDFMPPSPNRTDLIRIVEGVEGEVPIELLLAPRFDYGRNRPWVRQPAEGVALVAGPDALLLRSTPTAAKLRVDVSFDKGRVSGALAIKKGTRIALQLAWHPSHEAPPPALDVAAELARTEAYWRDWSGRCRYQGRFREPVLRSLITLKALTHGATGGIVAAPTTSLPEDLGGMRNWDYRFCWVRDATLTLDALLLGGYLDEAKAWVQWLMRAVAGDPRDMQIMYDLGGGRRLTEFELDWLPGYEGSRPVRIGNDASNQFQLDIYGELLSSMYVARRLGMTGDSETWAIGKVLIEHLEQLWQRPDDGIWEVRGGRKHFTYSKVSAWTAIDRSVRLIEEFGAGGDDGKRMVAHLRGLRERIHDEVVARGFNPRLEAFTQSYGSDTLDASLLVIPHMGFLPPRDPRMLGTVKAIERELVQDGFVLRYQTHKTADGLAGSEGAFLACSFWLADNYAMGGRIDEAEALFERLLGLRNHLGLLAEEYDTRYNRQVGNFPQAFSHLALIMSARILDAAAEKKDISAPLTDWAETPVH